MACCCLSVCTTSHGAVFSTASPRSGDHLHISASSSPQVAGTLQPSSTRGRGSSVFLRLQLQQHSDEAISLYVGPISSRGAITRVQAMGGETTGSSSSGDDSPSAAAATGRGPESSTGSGGGGGGCPACGREQMVGGCNGEGRIQGGIGAIPGFGWLPIKAYRPCPAFVETGGRYRRTGQSLEEVAFGRKGKKDDMDVSERLKR